MWRTITGLLLVLLLSGTTGAAKRKKDKKKPKDAATQTEAAVSANKSEKEKTVAKQETPPEKTEEAPVDDIHNEMEAYRAIQNRKEARVQDLADLLLMYRGEYGKFKHQHDRLKRARELDLVQKHNGEEKLDRGTVAYAVMKVYQPEKGLLFWLTGWERYALRDVQEASIMPAKSTESQYLSGEQLLGTITVAEEFVEHRKTWGKSHETQNKKH